MEYRKSYERYTLYHPVWSDSPSKLYESVLARGAGVYSLWYLAGFLGSLYISSGNSADTRPTGLIYP